MSALKYWLWLSAANVSIRTKWAVIEHFQDAELAFNAPDGELEKLGIGSKELQALEQRELKRAARIESVCRSKGIDIICFTDPHYPKRLKNISCPPVVLYAKGRLPGIDNNAPIAIIGTRKASIYGLNMAKRMAYEVCDCGCPLVSLVNGPIDEAALKGAMLCDASCVGVLASSLDEESRRIEDIAARGAVISEIAPGTESQKHHFKDRNRIAAGLSVGVLVIEAPEKSGTKYFCEEAAEQGKEIFALPGNADAENSKGTLALIKEGAKLVTRGYEVAEEFKALYPDKLKIKTEYNMPQEIKEREDMSMKTEADPIPVDKPAGKAYIDLKDQLSSLSEEQLKIISSIEPPSSHIDDIIERSGLPTAKVLGQLTMLELKGFVRREPGRRFSVKTSKK